MKKYGILSLVLFPLFAHATVDNFNNLISQSYQEQATAYRKVKRTMPRKTMVASDSRAKELDQLGRAPSSDQDFRIVLKPASKPQKL